MISDDVGSSEGTGKVKCLFKNILVEGIDWRLYDWKYCGGCKDCFVSVNEIPGGNQIHICLQSLNSQKNMCKPLTKKYKVKVKIKT